jgi:CDP-diacylglycerol--glycerol-3-phosphate 3-phosphatidyltransferase
MMTTANKITIARILLVPLFVLEMLYYIRSAEEWHRLVALLAFGIAACSDGLDGYIARRYQQRSELGAVLDPLADKLLLVSAILILSLHQSDHFPAIPLWVTALIISRDVLLIVGLGVIHHTFGKIKVRPRWIGKISTVLQMALILWVLLKWPEQPIFWISVLTAIFTAAAGLLYLWDGIRQLNASPASAASAQQNYDR